RDCDHWFRRNPTGYARGFGYPSAAASSRRDENSCTRADLRLDECLLAMDWRALCMGAGTLGRASATGRGLGCGSLGAPLRRVGLGSRSLAVKEFQAIDKIECIPKGIALLDVAVNAFLPSRASILRAIRPSEASCCSGTRCALSELFPVHRANLFQAAFDGLSSAAVPRGIRTSLASKWRGNLVHPVAREADGV